MEFNFEHLPTATDAVALLKKKGDLANLRLAISELERVTPDDMSHPYYRDHEITDTEMASILYTELQPRIRGLQQLAQDLEAEIIAIQNDKNFLN